MNKNKLKIVIALSIMVLGSTTYVRASTTSKVDNIKNHTLVVEESKGESIKSKENFILDKACSSDTLNKTSIVNIKDAKLKEIINKALGKNRDKLEDITVADMESLKELSSDSLPFLKNDGGEANRGITDISGLEYAVNLEILDLSENRISDLTPIKNLRKIKFLELFRNNIKNLRPLSNLKELEHLDIYNNSGITDTAPISGLSKLKWIDMHYCNRRTAPVNVEPLGKLINLEYLSIDDNFVYDISFTKKLVNLKTFSCNNNYVTDMSAVQDLAIVACNDWSGDHFFNMFGQMLKEPVKVNAPSKGTVYKMKTPVKGNDRYIAKLESVIKENDPASKEKAPAIQVLSSDNDYVSASYNYNTNEIELAVAKNNTNNKRECKYTIMLDYGMYGLKVEFYITQNASLSGKYDTSCYNITNTKN